MPDTDDTTPENTPDPDDDGSTTPEPTRTDHPAGDDQAAENADNEPPG